MKPFSRTTIAIFFAVILVTTPVGAVATAPQPNPSLAVSGQYSSMEYRSQAIGLVQQASLPGNRGDRLTQDLYDTQRAYVGPDRVNRSLFKTDNRIAASLNAKAPRAADALVRSDGKLARVAVTDAERTYSALRSDEASFDERAVSDELDRARKFLRKGDRQASRGQTSAIVHYGKAWHHAQRALDLMDTAKSPDVTITSSTDPVHEGTIRYEVTGTVQDVRNQDLQNVTLTLNSQTRTISLSQTTTPYGNATFSTTVELSEQLNTISVSVTDPGINYAEKELRVNGNEKGSNGNAKAGKGNGKSKGKNKHRKAKRGKKKGHGKHKGGGNDKSNDSDDTASAPVQTGSDTLRLDADALPDFYEHHTTETGQLDRDSDSAVTSIDENDNGLIDGVEDFDNDTVITYYEYTNGTDPFDSDTDDDNLTDAYELHNDQLDPTDPDTDGDGIPDGQEDFDGDDLDQDRGTFSVFGKTREWETAQLPSKALDRVQRFEKALDPPSDVWPVFPSGHPATLRSQLRQHFEALDWDVESIEDELDRDVHYWVLCREHEVAPPSVTVQGGRNLLKRLCKEADLDVDGEYLKPHGARRGLGDQLYAESAELSQEVLRHKSVETTHASYRGRHAEENRRQVEEITETGMKD